MEREWSSQMFLSCHSKELGDERDLPSHIPFYHALQLPFSQHVHHLVSLSGLPGGLEREKAHPRLRQPFDEAMVLFNEVIEILHLPQFTPFGEASSRFQFRERFGIGCVFVHVDHAWFVRMRGGECFVLAPAQLRAGLEPKRRLF